ncbi:MAG: DUF4938 domain-containing protein [Oscillochloridaceae bacterium umkhey_bin13]
MSTPITILRLHAYAGPNIYGPSPGVWLRLQCDRDYTPRLRAALKDGAQTIGMIIANLNVEAQAVDEGYQLTALFGTDAPNLGAALVTYVIEGITAEVQGDPDWDADEPLLTLQTRRRNEALPVAALQLIAEARTRGLPSFVRADGWVQLGYGVHGWGFDPTRLWGNQTTPPTPPWNQLASIPIVAVTGQTQRTATVGRLADELAARGLQPYVLDGVGFAATRVALADPAAEALILGLDSGDMLRHGLAFDRCELAVISDREGPRPAEADDDEAWVRALGIPMLLSPAPVRLNLSDPGLQALIPYAPNGVIAL